MPGTCLAPNEEKTLIKTILDNVLAGKELGFEEVRHLLLKTTRDDLPYLMGVADTIRRKHCGDKIDLCFLVNAKSGLCPEDCKFCAQSSKYDTGCKTYPLLSVEEIVESAKEAKRSGATNFCIVVSGTGPSRDEFNDIKKAIIRINKEVGIKVDCSLGTLRLDMAKELKNLGVDRYNHNLETSPNFYRNICTTHPYRKRWDMVAMLKEVGLSPCCGGIIGLGETTEERVELMFSLKKLDIKCVPVNILNPRKGTPLENIKQLSPLEIIKIIAVFRLVLPDAVIKIAGGREYALRDFQAMAFMAGANGMIIGGYLTTRGRPVEQDLQMVRDMGFK